MRNPHFYADSEALMRRALAGAGSSSLWSQSCKPEQKMRNPHFNADQGGTDEMLRCRCRYTWSGVCPDKPNKKCGIRILMLTRAEQMRCAGASAGIHGLESVLITRTKNAESAFLCCFSRP